MTSQTTSFIPTRGRRGPHPSFLQGRRCGQRGCHSPEAAQPRGRAGIHSAESQVLVRVALSLLASSKFTSSNLQGENMSTAAPPSVKGLLFWPGNRSPCPGHGQAGKQPAGRVLGASSTRARASRPPTGHLLLLPASLETEFALCTRHPCKVHSLKRFTSEK